MMISDGNEMQADSIPISNAMPKYPEAEITAMMKCARTLMIFSVIRRKYSWLPLCYHGVYEEYPMAEALIPEVSEQTQPAAEPQTAPAKQVKRQIIGFT